MAASAAFDVESITRERNRRGIAGQWTPEPERIPSSYTDTNLSTSQTVKKMGANIAESLPDPKIQAIAATTSAQWGQQLPYQKCWDVFWFCKHHVKFELDERAMLALLNEADQIDFLMSPSVLMRMYRPCGDCDDFTMLACALLTLNGVRCEIVTVMADKQRPGEWSHVYCRAVLPDGRHMPIDPTVGDYPGWEVPACDIQRMQAWDLAGNPIPTAPSYHASKLQGYTRRGVGQDGTTTTDLSNVGIIGGTGTVGSLDPTLSIGALNPSLTPNADLASIWSQISSPAPAGSPSTINWGQVIGASLTDVTKIAQQALLPSGSSLVGGNVISPSGAAGGAFLSTNALGQQTFGGIPVQTLMMFLLIGGAAFLLLKAAK